MLGTKAKIRQSASWSSLKLLLSATIWTGMMNTCYSLNSIRRSNAHPNESIEDEKVNIMKDLPHVSTEIEHDTREEEATNKIVNSRKDLLFGEDETSFERLTGKRNLQDDEDDGNICIYRAQGYAPFEGTDYDMSFDVIVWLDEPIDSNQQKSMYQAEKALPKALAKFMRDDQDFKISMMEKNFVLNIPNGDSFDVEPATAGTMDRKFPDMVLFRMTFRFPALYGNITYKCKKGYLATNIELQNRLAKRLSQSFEKNFATFLDYFDKELKRSPNYDLVNILLNIEDNSDGTYYSSRDS